MEFQPLNIYNTLSRQKERFEPLNPPFVGLYVCGPTVYSDVHLGNCRTFISFDLIYRYLLHLGYKVRYVRNITDAGAKEDINPADVEREREILSEAARNEGKPENIIAKMVEGRLRNFFAERALLEQPFVKDDKLTVGKYAQQHGLKVVRYVHWELGK